MIEATIPTQKEIAQLTRWAKVAFAARCARRVLPLFQDSWPTARKDYITAVTQAVEIAERSAAASHIAEDNVADRAAQESANRCANAALVVSYAARKENAAAYDAALAALGAARATVYSADRGAKATSRAARVAARAVRAAARAMPTAVRAIRADFVALTKAARNLQWTADTTIPPEFFGPFTLDVIIEEEQEPELPVPILPAQVADELSSTRLRSPSATVQLQLRPQPWFATGDRVPHAEKWELLEKLGQGGFGEVWLARHRQTNEERAVKFCLHAVARHQLTRVARHESNVAEYVHQHMSEPGGCHPNIVPLLECNLTGECPWLMYEYVPGRRSLADVIQELKAQPVADRIARAIPLLRTIATAVGKFHHLPRSIVHRDLTPKNVLMAGDVPRIIDFGIGGASVVVAVANATGGLTELTVRVPTLLRSAGTPPHASREQLRGDEPHPRDDVYALGVMAYQMVTGELGAPGADARDKLEELGVPDGLVKLIVKSVSDPARRPQDAVAWAEALAPLLPDSRAAPVPVTRFVTVPGTWFSRPTSDEGAQWQSIGNSPREITFEPDYRYSLEISKSVTDSELKGLLVLAGVSSFSWLYLTDCTGVTDLAPLAALTHLESLDLRGCAKVSHLAPLAVLTGLAYLNLRSTAVTDLTPLVALQNLKYLSVTDTGVSVIPNELRNRVHIVR